MKNEDFKDWLAHPVTVAIYKKLNELRKTLEEGLGSGQTLGLTADETHGRTARIVGNLEGLNQLLNICYEDETEEAINE